MLSQNIYSDSIDLYPLDRAITKIPDQILQKMYTYKETNFLIVINYYTIVFKHRLFACGDYNLNSIVLTLYTVTGGMEDPLTLV